jgi:hypothetical protein
MTQNQAQGLHGCSMREHSRPGWPAKVERHAVLGKPQYLTRAATGGVVQMQISPRRPSADHYCRKAARAQFPQESLSPLQPGRVRPETWCAFSPALALFADPVGPSASVDRIQQRAVAAAYPRSSMLRTCCDYCALQ